MSRYLGLGLAEVEMLISQFVFIGWGFSSLVSVSFLDFQSVLVVWYLFYGPACLYVHREYMLALGKHRRKAQQGMICGGHRRQVQERREAVALVPL